MAPLLLHFSSLHSLTVARYLIVLWHPRLLIKLALNQGVKSLNSWLGLAIEKTGIWKRRYIGKRREAFGDFPLSSIWDV